MRILHVITSLRTGGAEKLMVDLMPRFRAMGHCAELLLFDGTPTPFLKNLSDQGITIHHLSIGGNVYNPALILKLRKFLSDYDIIHTHNTACQFFVAIASRMFHTKAVLVTTEHNTTNRRRNIPGFRLIDRWIYCSYKRIICIADSTAEALKLHIGDSSPLLVINNGIDLTHFLSEPPADFDNNEKVIITMIAAFRPQKDQDTLIKAMALLPDNYKLWLVGDGIRRKSLEALTAGLGLSNRVDFLGVRTDIPAIMKKSHIIVLSSHWEGLSLSSVEGCASGRPVIASDVPGLREVIGGAGLLFAEGDSDSLASAVMRLASDTALYRETAHRCLNRAKNYDITLMASRYNDLYLSLIK